MKMSRASLNANIAFSRQFLATIVVCAACMLSVTPAESEEAIEHARKLLRQTLLIDGHNDLAWVIRTAPAASADVKGYDLRVRTPGQTDLARLREGGIGAQFWSVYVPTTAGDGFARTQLEQIDLARRMIEHYPETLQFTRTVAEIRSAHQSGRIASLLAIEGGHVIENSLGVLRTYYALGVRSMTLTHVTHTDWADSATQVPARHQGLAAFGEEVISEMNRLGMLVDLSHTSDQTMQDSLRISKAPVIFSHSAARALVDVPRNVPDEILRALPSNGGIVMVAFVASFVDPEVARLAEPAYREYMARSPEAQSEAEQERLYQEIVGRISIPSVPVSRVADHIEHIRNVAGIAHVGIGADYDGNDLWPEHLQDVSGYPYVFAELIRRGWPDSELKMLAGENLLRVLEHAETVAAELQRTTPASTAKFQK
jgi:membrane dipeptidase